MNLYDVTVPQLIKMLKNADRWMAAAIRHAENKKFDVNNLVKFRLAPDQFSFDQQIQTACDVAKYIPARLTGKLQDMPSHPYNEKTFDELRALIASVISHLETFKPEEFSDGEARKISLSFMNGKWMRGDEYVIQFSGPNFYFHLVTAYEILRHNGVELGNSDYIGGVPLRD